MTEEATSLETSTEGLRVLEPIMALATRMGAIGAGQVQKMEQVVDIMILEVAVEDVAVVMEEEEAEEVTAAAVEVDVVEEVIEKSELSSILSI